jgi:hypothetical protein
MLGAAADSSYLYCADGGSGLHVLDLAEPSAPILVGGAASPGSAQDVVVHEGRVYVADRGAGVVIFPGHCARTTPVALSWYEVSSTEGAVTIAWQTAFERDHLGFHLDRAEEGSNRFERLTAELIPSTGELEQGYEFIDRTTLVGVTYRYRLEAIDVFGGVQTFDLGTVTVRRGLPTRLVLHPNHPNPFNPRTSIPFELPVTGPVRLRIYDANGRMVRTLVDDMLVRDFYSVEWDGRNDAGKRLASGIYLYRLDAAERSLSRKLVLVR